MSASDAIHTETLSPDPRGAGESRQAPHLFLVLDAGHPCRTAGARWSLGRLDGLTLGRGSTLAATPGHEDGTRTLRVQIDDAAMSSRHARLGRSGETWWIEDSGSKNGVWVNGQRRERVQLADGDVFELGKTFFLYRASLVEDARSIHALELEPDRPPGLRTLVPALASWFDKAKKIASSDAPVLLSGETGTGKEVVARAIHTLSGRIGALVPVNCGAIPAGLVESEFFGHARGAFTGAIDSRTGKILAAHEGTLFLDEVGEMPEPAQIALLRVLEEKTVVPVGSGRAPTPVDLRVIAASNRELPARVQEGRFRADLFARLAGFQLELPPLRERREDFGLLVSALLRDLAGARADRVSFDGPAARALLAHTWPLNVRELRRCLEVALALASDRPIGVDDLPASVLAAPPRPAKTPDYRSAAGSDEEAEHRAELESLLRAHDGNLTAVARAVGKDPKQVRRWLAKLGIDPEAFRKK